MAGGEVDFNLNNRHMRWGMALVVPGCGTAEHAERFKTKYAALKVDDIDMHKRRNKVMTLVFRDGDFTTCNTQYGNCNEGDDALQTMTAQLKLQL